MKHKVMIEATIKEDRGAHYVVEDKVNMEVHDLVDYLVLKYVTRGNKLQALPARLTTELSREEMRIEDERTV